MENVHCAKFPGSRIEKNTVIKTRNSTIKTQCDIEQSQNSRNRIDKCGQVMQKHFNEERAVFSTDGVKTIAYLLAQR